MANKKLTPAALVAARFGGVRKAGRLLGSEYIVSLWIQRGGQIPNAVSRGTKRNNHQKILELAKREKVPLTMDDVLNGGYLQSN